MIDLNRLTIGFIGAGKTGVSLGVYLKSKGFDIAGYISRSRESAEKAAGITESKAFDKPEELVEQSGMIVIATPDSSIGDVWKILSALNIRGKIICHTSGALSSGIFEGAETLGAAAFSIHPMYAFSNRDGHIEGIDSAFFTIEGDQEKLEDIKALFTRLGNKTLVLSRSSKALYHAANVMASNHVLALMSMGCLCLEKCGIEGQTALEALTPLIKGNIESIFKKGFVNSLTGPVERNDVNTVKRHLEVLPCEYQGIYRNLTKELIILAQKKHPDYNYAQLSELCTVPERIDRNEKDC